MRHHIIYVPGIADDIGKVQSTLVKLWRIHGVDSSTHVMPWLHETDYKSSQARLTQRISRLVARGYRVSLVGASAGGSAVLTAYYNNPAKISGVVIICPKIHNPQDIGKIIISKNPTFEDYMADLQLVLPKLSDQQKRKIVNFYSPADKIVLHEDSNIAGVKEIRLPALPHNLAILYGISIGSRRLIKELKRIADSA